MLTFQRQLDKFEVNPESCTTSGFTSVSLPLPKLRSGSDCLLFFVKGTDVDSPCLFVGDDVGLGLLDAHSAIHVHSGIGLKFDGAGHIDVVAAEIG